MEYEDNGEFSNRDKILYSIKRNSLLILYIFGGCSFLLLVLIFLEGFSFMDIDKAAIIASNMIGHILVAVSMGIGLITLPLEYYIDNFNYNTEEYYSEKYYDINEEKKATLELLKSEYNLLQNFKNISILIRLKSTRNLLYANNDINSLRL